ncbi:ephrin type-A receptor 7-like isoform X1 [Montipora capricornis]|uniref:ephrin type-A receptor 7-like isoform X1 n=2 Tax=Montipora capricornis TaxID=246305 RepID=UPI0035F1A245
MFHSSVLAFRQFSQRPRTSSQLPIGHAMLMGRFWTALISLVVFAHLTSSEREYILAAPPWVHPKWDNSINAKLLIIRNWDHPSHAISGSVRDRYSVCNIDNIEEPNNWLRSGLIPVGEIERLDVTIEYKSRQCPPTFRFCRNSFYAYVWESNASLDLGQIPNPISNYSLYRRFANISRLSDKRQKLTMPVQVTSKYIVLGFRDRGGCRTLYSVKVSYKVCTEKAALADSLVYLPRTFPQLASVTVEGRCAASSTQSLPGSLIVLCDSNGEWNTSQLEGRCLCKEGMENSGGICLACPLGTFNDGKGFNCTEIPSAPKNVKVTFVNQTVIGLTWGPPETTDDQSRVYYDVECWETCNENKDNKCHDRVCDNDVNYIPSKQGINKTQVMITNLSSFVNYKLTIYSRNRVSDLAQEMHGLKGNFALISVTTNESHPGRPEVSVKGLSEKGAVFVSWTLDEKNGIIMNYYVAYSRKDNFADRRSVNTTQMTQRFEGLMAGRVYEFQVYAVNNYGKGPAGVKEFYLPNGGSQSRTYTIYFFMTVILGTILFTVATLACLYVYHRRKARPVENFSAPRASVQEDIPIEFFTPGTNTDAAMNGGQYMHVSDIPCLELDRNKIKYIKLLGSGNFGEVYKAIFDDTAVAVKSLKENATLKDKQDMLTELQVMKCLRPHPHVLKLIGCQSSSDPILIVLEYMPYGDLLGYLRKSRGHCDVYNSGEKKPTSRLIAMDLLSFAWMIADGMSYLASMKVVHRDLAARNILVGENKVCKISDFGLARDVNADIYVRTSQARLPVKWMPPESLFLGESSTLSDVWSYGIVLWEVFTIGDSPYPGVKSREVASLLEGGYRMPRPDHISEELYSVMSECWSEKPDARPTFPWICTAMKRLMADRKTYVNLDVYNDKDYVNFDMTDDLQ